MAQDSTELQYVGDGNILVAPYGTAIPETLGDELDAAFRDLGYASTDGVTDSFEQEVSETEAWQSDLPIDRRVTKRMRGLAATLLQTNRENYALAFGDGTWAETAPEEYEYTPPADTDPLAEYVVVVEIFDGDVHDRIILKRATMTEAVEIQHVRNEAAQYPLKFDALRPEGEESAWKLQTNNPDHAPEGS
jgi:hypothetical protein